MALEETSSFATRKRQFVTRLGWTASTGLVALIVALVMTAAGAGVGASSNGSGTASLPAGFTEGRVNIDGGSLHYVRGGSGPALVLLHGWPETWWQWRNTMSGLAANHTVIAFDLPGLGTSSIPTGGFDAASTARRIRQGVNALGFTQVKLLGHDVGALVAYPYARDFPTEVSRLAVLETPLNGFGLEDVYGLSFHFKFNMAPAPIPETIMDDEDVSTYLGMMYQFSFNRAGIDADTYYRAYADPLRRAAGYNYYRAFETNRTDNLANAAAKRLTQPVLAMGGQYSFGPGVAGSFSQVANDVRTSIAPNSGHYIPEENPAFLVDCANLFFGPSGVTPDPARPELAGCGA